MGFPNLLLRIQRVKAILLGLGLVGPSHHIQYRLAEGMERLPEYMAMESNMAGSTIQMSHKAVGSDRFPSEGNFAFGACQA